MPTDDGQTHSGQSGEQRRLLQYLNGRALAEGHERLLRRRRLLLRRRAEWERPRWASAEISGRTERHLRLLLLLLLLLKWHLLLAGKVVRMEPHLQRIYVCRRSM